MNRIFRHILLTSAAILAGCGDDALFEQEDVASVSQQIYVVPERFTGEPYTFGYQPRPVYLDVDEVVKFWATYIVNNRFLHTDFYDDYIAEKSWDVEGEYFNINSFRYSFSEPGHKVVTLMSVDHFNDTIVEKMDIYVNTPISISISYPQDGYNMVDPRHLHLVRPRDRLEEPAGQGQLRRSRNASGASRKRPPGRFFPHAVLGRHRHQLQRKGLHRIRHDTHLQFLYQVQGSRFRESRTPHLVCRSLEFRFRRNAHYASQRGRRYTRDLPDKQAQRSHHAEGRPANGTAHLRDRKQKT